MKQITYNYTTAELAQILADYEGVEGSWVLNATIESTPCSIPSLVQGQAEGVFPGAMFRIIGIQITEVSNGLNRDSGGPVQSVESPGENSESVGKSVSRPKRKSRRALNRG